MERVTWQNMDCAELVAVNAYRSYSSTTAPKYIGCYNACPGSMCVAACPHIKVWRRYLRFPKIHSFGLWIIFNVNLKDWLRRMCCFNYSWQYFNTEDKIVAHLVLNHSTDISKENDIHIALLSPHMHVGHVGHGSQRYVSASAVEWQQMFRQTL